MIYIKEKKSKEIIKCFILLNKYLNVIFLFKSSIKYPLSIKKIGTAKKPVDSIVIAAYQPNVFCGTELII